MIRFGDLVEPLAFARRRARSRRRADLGEVEVASLVVARRGPPAADGFYHRIAEESLLPPA